MTKPIDILCVGETLIDLISNQQDVDLAVAEDYHRYLGGSPTNVAMHMARLGMNVRLASTIGDDGLGRYILDNLKGSKLDNTLVRTDAIQPTSVIFVSKTTGTPDFIAYRKADVMITENQIPYELLEQTKIFHTTAFALSKNPARNTILTKAKEAKEAGCTLSIDINYSPKIWSDRAKAMKCIKDYCRYDPLVKISEDDMTRLFDDKLTHDEIFTFFHEHLKVSTVCLTLGDKGVKLCQGPKRQLFLPAVKVEKVAVATGAGDAFWSGFLFAYNKGFEMERCLKIGLSLAATKLAYVGNIPNHIDVLPQLLQIT